MCLVFNAGELSLIEYGDNSILSSVRTEFANPHLISVRLNERVQSVDNKKLAYLLDLKTICIVDLMSGVTIGQVQHDSKIDWLELSETAHKLLFRDKKRRLFMVETATGEKNCLFSNVTFVQWVTGSDVAVAQSNNNLVVWYNMELPDHPTLIPVRGEVYDVVRGEGKTQALAHDGHATLSYELDEGLVEFGTAIHDSDYGRAVLFLESIGDKPEAEAMWHSLANIALGMQNLSLAERCFAALGDVSKAFYLQETARVASEYERDHGPDTTNQCAEVWARLAVLSNDLLTAENIYLEQGDLDGALNMYKNLHRWDEAVRLAERRGYNKLDELKEQHMQFLHRTGQHERAGRLLEERGETEQAIALYLQSGRAVRAAALVAQHSELLNNEPLTTAVIHRLLDSELFEPAADLYERLGRPEQALDCYRRAGAFAKAVELARHVSPERVIELEEEWADSLVNNRQMDAAISHYIEAGRTRQALDAAIAAKQWKKAVHIIQVIDDVNSVHNQYVKLAVHYASTEEHELAERFFVTAGLYGKAVDMYNKAGLWEKAYALAVRHLDSDEVSNMYTARARNLENEGKLRDAERLYVTMDEPDLAIAMYKRREQYENMLKLVERFHPDLVQTTHVHLAQALEQAGKQRAAEVHYLAANEWKAALNMYRAATMWDEAHRIAKKHGGQQAANQIAYLWARSLSIESAIKLLTKFGILEWGIDYACETFQFEFAFQLCKKLPSKVSDVHLKYAMALEDDGKFAEAEGEFVAAGKPKEAILMYVHGREWTNALRVAETQMPEAVPEVLKAHAQHCFEEGRHNEFEALLLRAQMPELIVQHYQQASMWMDALRVCKEYAPSLLTSVQSEYARAEPTGSSAVPAADLETLLTRANEWVAAGQHARAVDCLLQVNSEVAELDVERRALLRAAELVNKHLPDDQALEVTKRLAPRLLKLGENTTAAQLYLNSDLLKEAIDSFIQCEDWTRARKIARELEPAYENYVESKYKERLRSEGDVEQLADIDLSGALDLLAEQGQWARCLEKARAHGAPVLQKYVALNATQLLHDGYILEALALYVTNGAPALKQNFNIYTRIALGLYAMPGIADNYSTWTQLRQVLHEIVRGLDDQDESVRQHFDTLLMVAHLYAVRAACQHVHTLGTITVKISVALVRYSDLIPADKAYYEAGMALRSQGRESEAFVLLNHYLDICEAIEEGEPTLVDHADLELTDFPASFPLPAELYLREEPRVHDDVREWVLAVSMDRQVITIIDIFRVRV